VRKIEQAVGKELVHRRAGAAEKGPLNRDAVLGELLLEQATQGEGGCGIVRSGRAVADADPDNRCG